MMFPMVLPLPRTSISAGTGFECFLAHAGSASMASGLRAGGFPSKVTVPVMDEAATATPGQPATATSPAASHNLFRCPAHAPLLGHRKPSLRRHRRRCLPPILEWPTLHRVRPSVQPSHSLVSRLGELSPFLTRSKCPQPPNSSTYLPCIVKRCTRRPVDASPM